MLDDPTVLLSLITGLSKGDCLFMDEIRAVPRATSLEGRVGLGISGHRQSNELAQLFGPLHLGTSSGTCAFGEGNATLLDSECGHQPR